MSLLQELNYADTDCEEYDRRLLAMQNIEINDQKTALLERMMTEVAQSRDISHR